MKKILIIVISIAVVLAIAVGVVIAQAKRTISRIETEYAAMGTVSLSSVPDGIYHGKFGSIPVFVSLSVAVKDHRIDNISIQKQLSGKGYDAKDMIPRIMRTQNLRADAVTGATISSKCIMIAVYKALNAAGQPSPAQ